MLRILSFFLFLMFFSFSSAQKDRYWHGKERSLRYIPNGDDFVIVNGDKRFNRALYGTNTAFRVETGDMPEFGLFMPRMGGNIQLGLLIGDDGLWLNDAAQIRSIYRAGSRIYEITDPFLGKGILRITVLAMADAEGAIIRIEPVNLDSEYELITTFGGANNKGFFRNGDLGVDDPEAFSLKPENCSGNIFEINDDNHFSLTYGEGTKGGPKEIVGSFSNNSHLKLGSPYAMSSVKDVVKSNSEKNQPILVARTPLRGEEVYFGIKLKNERALSPHTLPKLFLEAESKRSKIASTVKIKTPDPYLNPLGGVLSIAADGIWDEPTGTWQHGAVGWRMPLNGWRAAYVGDAIGWHERAREHFNGYAASQVTTVEPIIPHPSQDSTLNLARAMKKWGTQMYSNGYIARNPRNPNQMHHYDMNLVYIDELLWHFNWTGDMDYVKQMWPVLERHLAWEKRNFDPDNDGLYDSYACIWASDALQYNSGSVTFSSAYNYRANKMAAEIARKIGKDPTPYKMEAEKILNAINATLWLPHLGRWAEYKDYMGNKLIHPDAGLWTVYHALDSDIHTPFQAFEATRYIDTHIPHIPVRAKGLDDEDYYTLSTTNWLPYSWSINNVAFAEVAHTSLAYWQAGRYEEACKLFKSNILDGMYLGSSPGNIGQVSFYDAARGECYRDFGDPIGVYARALVQGLFGVLPDAMNNRLVVRPGFPSDWPFASIKTSNIQFDFKRVEKKDTYTITPSFGKEMALDLLIRAPFCEIKKITVNNMTVNWQIEQSVNHPMIRIDCPTAPDYLVIIEWDGDSINNESMEWSACQGEQITIHGDLPIQEVYDPQSVLENLSFDDKTFSGIISGEAGHRTIFTKVKQGDMEWWQSTDIRISLPNNTQIDIDHSLMSFNMRDNDDQREYEMIDMDNHFNASVSQIFKNEYLSPRSPFTTLQIPKQGIGEWCHPKLTAEINDFGLRAASKDGVFETPIGIPFRTPSSQGDNILFTSLWDNYPTKVNIPLKGRSPHAYLLMAGSTNHMQCHVTNGEVTVTYVDGSTSVLKLVPPETWAPIEQDFYFDGYAFKSKQPRPYRVTLKTGRVTRSFDDQIDADEVYGRSIDGGAGIILDIPLNKNKELKSINIKTIANDVVIGLMAITLVR